MWYLYMYIYPLCVCGDMCCWYNIFPFLAPHLILPWTMLCLKQALKTRLMHLNILGSPTIVINHFLMIRTQLPFSIIWVILNRKSSYFLLWNSLTIISKVENRYTRIVIYLPDALDPPPTPMGNNGISIFCMKMKEKQLLLPRRIIIKL